MEGISNSKKHINPKRTKEDFLFFCARSYEYNKFVDILKPFEAIHKDNSFLMSQSM
jgi:hypothetical protein